MSQIFGNTLEAVVGAIYLDKGYKKTQEWVFERDHHSPPVYGRPRKSRDQS